MKKENEEIEYDVCQFKHAKAKVEAIRPVFFKAIKEMAINSIAAEVYANLSGNDKLLIEIYDSEEREKLLYDKYGESFYNSLKTEMINFVLLMLSTL